MPSGGIVEEPGCERGQALRLDVVAVRREALEAVPEAGDRADLVTEPERVGIGAGAQSVGDGFPDVVVGERFRRPVAADRVEPPFECDVVGDFGEPGLGAVHVAVDGQPEAIVEREDQLG